MKYSPISRRMFLQGAGGYLLSVPFLTSMAPRALAQAAKPPMRFVMILGKHGRDPVQWYPSIADSSMQTVAPGVLATRLAQLPQPISHNIGGAFAPVINKITLIRGLDCLSTGGNHNQSVPTTGSSLDPTSSGGFGYSIDAVLEESTKFYPSAPQLTAFRACPHPENEPSEWNSYSFSSKNIRGQLLPSDWNPIEVYKNLLSGPAVQSQNLVNARLRNVTDLVFENFRQTISSRKVSHEDKLRLDNYMGLLSDTHKQVSTVAKECARATQPSINAVLRVELMSNIHKAMMNLELAALACGSTKIVMHIIKYSGDHRFEDPAFSPSGFGGLWHQRAHGGEFDVNPATGRSQLSEYSKFNMDLVAHFLTEMDKIDDGGGATLLDNTLFIYGNEDGTGSHEHFDLPVLVAGGQGRLRMGNYIDYRPRPVTDLIGRNTNIIRKGPLYAGRPYNSLLVTALQALGLGPADYQKFGTQGFGRYDKPSVNLPANHYARFMGSAINDPLPYLWAG